MKKKTARAKTVIGIDPGSRIAGFCVLSVIPMQTNISKKFEIIEAGEIKISASLALPQRIGLLFGATKDLINEFKPDVCVVEKSFYGLNQSTAIKLGEIRGALIAAICSSEINYAEITPAEVKKRIAGNGRADKSLVEQGVFNFTGFKRGKLSQDVSDAVAIALCHGLSL